MSDDAARAAAWVRQATALVFDFDGTLVDSNPIKRRGFEFVFADAPRREEILDYCRRHVHLPRGEKFRHACEQIAGQPYTPEVAARLEGRFEDATTRQIIEAPEVPGALRWLQGAAGRQVTALLSSTPQETLERILAQRAWRPYFEVVQGAPVDKGAWLASFRQSRRLPGEAVVCFGDALQDAAAARQAGCRFVGVGPALRGAVSDPVIDDWTGMMP